EPSMERSIDPMMMTKVTPSAIISAGVDEMAMRAKLRIDRKFGLSAAKNRTSASSTSSGAHFCRLSLVSTLLMAEPHGEGRRLALSASHLKSGAWPAGGHARQTQDGYVIWPLEGPQKSFQSYSGLLSR